MYRIDKILSAHEVSWIVFAIQEAGYSKYTIAIGASWVATESNCEMLELIFLTHQIEAVDTPKSLVFIGRCGEDGSSRGYKIGGLDRRDSGLAVRVDIDIEMAYRRDA